MEGKWLRYMIFVVEIMVLLHHYAESKPGRVSIDVKAHVNGKKVLDVSHPEKLQGKNISSILVDHQRLRIHVK